MSLAQIMTFGTAKSSTISNERGPGQNSLGKSLASQIEIVGKGRGVASEGEESLPP